MDDDNKLETSNKTELRQLVDTLQDSEVSIENHKRVFDKIKGSNQSVKIQIENLEQDHRDINNRLKALKSRDQFTRMYDDGFIPKEVYEAQQSLYKTLRDAYNWKALQTRMLEIIFNKIVDLLHDVKSLEIKRDALNEMREMVERQNSFFTETISSQQNFFKEIILGKLQNSDEKFAIVLEQNQKAYKEMLKMVITSIPFKEMSQETKAEISKKVSELDEGTKPAHFVAHVPKPQMARPVIPESVKQEFSAEPKKDANISDIDSDFQDFEE